MSYQVLALKYRPQTFDDVVGQSHVTTTLSNAIKKNRVAHAILFTGPRGTGKTTIARILAKAMNCATGPTPRPCNTCKTCTEIIQGHCADVFEIDGASNNSVDQVRDLRENVTYLPASAPYKIYIIDEVHMLSTAAFNALLKTLEEPPDHVLFIFATTEVHKIPATILSRCQRHDLGRIPLDAILDHLAGLCEKEGFSIDRQGLELIAREADGSIRDSLSLLDRILSAAAGRDISYDQVVEGLGVLDRAIMHDITTAVFEKNGASLISCIETVNDTGLDLKKFYADIIHHFRNLNVVKLCGPDNPAVNMTRAEIDRIHQAVAGLPDGYLGILLQMLLTDESMVKYASHTRIAIETVLLKLLQINPDAQLDRIIQKLDQLAGRIGGSEPRPSGSTAATKAGPGREAAGPPPGNPPPGNPPPGMPPGTPGGTPGMPWTPNGSPDSSRMPPPAPPAQAPGPTQSPDYGYETNVAPAAPKTWQGFLTHIEQRQAFLAALLSKGRLTDTGTGAITVELYNCSAFDKKRLHAKQDELKKACRGFLGKDLTVRVVAENTPEAAPQAAPHANDFKAKHAAFNHPLVMDAQKIFDGEIINY